MVAPGSSGDTVIGNPVRPSNVPGKPSSLVRLGLILSLNEAAKVGWCDTSFAVQLNG